MPVGISVFADVFCRGRNVARLAHSWLVGAAAVALLVVFSASTASAQTASVTAVWDRNTDTLTTGYVVHYGTTPGSYAWSYDAGNLTSAQLTLTRGSIYYFVVRAYNTSALQGPPSNEATIDLRTTTPAPTATLTATLQNGNTAVVTWQTTNAVSATLNGASVPLNGTQNYPVSTTTTFTIVAANSAGATVTRSATVTVTPPSTSAPSAPTNMAVAVSGARATFSWRAPSSGAAPTGYLVDVGVSGTTRMIASGHNVGNVLSVAADLPKGRYNARVRAANAAGISGYSNLYQFRIGRTLVSPSGFSVQWVGTTAVLSWTAPTADGAVENVPTAYVLEAGTAPGMSDVATVNLGNVTRFSAPIPGGVYYVRVRAENAYGGSDPTPDLVLVPPDAPGAPNTLVASRVNSTVNLRWNAPAGSSVSGYVIEAGSAPGLSDVARLQVGPGTTFSAVAPVGTYYIRVRALNGRGPGLPSNEVLVQ